MLAHDPDQATEWVRNMPEGASKSRAESTIARIWAEKDPSASAKWLGTLSEKEQTDLVGTIVRTWANSDWPETSRWIETLSGEVHDYAISNAMNRDAATESDSLTLALSIRDDELRKSRIENVIQNWSYSDPQAAQAWVKSSPLSPEEQNKLFSVISDAQNAAAPEATDERVIITH
jgi:hypothetical protein